MDLTKYHTQLGLEGDWMQDVSSQTAHVLKGIQIQLSWQDLVFVKTAQIESAIDSILLVENKEISVTHAQNQEFLIAF